MNYNGDYTNFSSLGSKGCKVILLCTANLSLWPFLWLTGESLGISALTPEPKL